MRPDLAKTPCPTDDTLGALVHHALEPAEAEEVTAHLDVCAACQAAVIAAVRGGAAPTLAAGSRRGSTGAHAPSAASSAARVGERLGRYQLRGLLGAGGMGAVYEAYDGELERAVALKLLRAELAGSAPALAERLLRESRLMAKVRHPAVIVVHDVGREGARVFLAMELVHGGTLTTWLAAAPRTWRSIVDVFERAGRGLAAAHAAGVVHRDFKPDNVLVERDTERVVVTDFGIARAAASAASADAASAASASDASADAATPDARAPRGDVQLTLTGAAIGTPAYMAPEQLAGGVVDHRADVFAFSVSLWEALFGARPFPGRTAAEIYAAMQLAPVRAAKAARVPRRLVRALLRGLALEPAARWPDLPSLLDEIAAIRRRPRRWGLALAAAGLIAIGGAAAWGLGAGQGVQAARCSDGLARVYHPGVVGALGRALAGDPATRASVVAKLEGTAAAWRSTDHATCAPGGRAAQAPTTAACLEARRIELAGYIDDLLDGAAGVRGRARELIALIGNPAACAAPAPGLLLSRVPADVAVRRKVTALRVRAFEAEAARDRTEFPVALAAATQLVGEAAAAWPPLHAEALYLLGTVQSQGGETKRAIPTLREAAAVAERAHHDYIAANAWIQLVLGVAFDEGDIAHALEYVPYAEAALDRIGRPASVTVLLEYARGAVLIEADRSAEGEAALSRALALAETAYPQHLPQVIQGLGYLYEEQGRYAEAAAAYRKAIDRMPRTAAGEFTGGPVFFERLAVNLSLLGDAAAAEAEARRAVALAERTLPEANIDRAVAYANLAQVLQNVGKLAPALAESDRALAAIARIQGERNERYGEALQLRGSLLVDLERHGEAAPALARACEIVAFATGEESSSYASCEMSYAAALVGLRREREALVRLEHAVATLRTAHGPEHPEVGNALLSRGSVHSALGQRAQAIADFEQAIALLSRGQLEVGHLAAAHWALGKELWASARPRAAREVEEAVRLFATALPAWKKERTAAEAWLASGGPTRPRAASAH